jgi:hypothetical protein
VNKGPVVVEASTSMRAETTLVASPSRPGFDPLWCRTVGGVGMEAGARWLLSLGLVVIAACGHETDLSPVPAVSDLTIQNPVVTVGGTVQVKGALSYLDGDADLTSLYIAVTTPAGQSQTVGPSPAAGVENRRAGTLSFSFTLNVAAPGDYQLELWLVDAADNESNHLTGTVTAQ